MLDVQLQINYVGLETYSLTSLHSGAKEADIVEVDARSAVQRPEQPHTSSWSKQEQACIRRQSRKGNLCRRPDCTNVGARPDLLILPENVPNALR